MQGKLNALALAAAGITAVSAQTYQRLGACPKLGCLLPPDQSDFLPGQLFDLRVEVHAPANGSEAFNDGKPDEDFSVTITKKGGDGEPQDVASFFEVDEPELETWEFGWYEDLFAEDKDEETQVNVASKIYRKIAISEPGEYEVTLSYYDGETTVANWVVRPIKSEKRAKNIIFFIGDGMTTNMITAARLLGHKSINGKFQSLLQMDKFPVLGHQMTHSIDSFITDSANSASALYTGHKSTVNAMGVYADSSEDAFDDPKVETITELISRKWGSVWGAVTTSALSDATPAALSAHTRNRNLYGPIVDQALRGQTNYTWSENNGPDVYFGGGAEQFFAGDGSYEGKDYYREFADQGFTVSTNRTSLLAADPNEKALGVFCQSHMPVWLDRNVYKENLEEMENHPLGGEEPATDLPGLKDMAVKAVEILHNRGGDDGFFLMTEAASIDKQMHAMDYDRALGDLLELDDTIKATIAKLEELGVLEETLIVVSADHGHGFDVFGNADTEYLAQQEDDRSKRRAIGIYQKSGLSGYTEDASDEETSEGDSYDASDAFPVNWTPRYAIAAGVVAHPDYREDYKGRDAPREPAVTDEDADEEDYYANPEDSLPGFVVNGTLPVEEAQGVHSLTDVPVFAMGPCQELFAGVYNNIDIFYKIAECYGLGLSKDGGNEGGNEGGDGGYDEGSDGEQGGENGSEGSEGADGDEENQECEESDAAETEAPTETETPSESEVADGENAAETSTESEEAVETPAESEAADAEGQYQEKRSRVHRNM